TLAVQQDKRPGYEQPADAGTLPAAAHADVVQFGERSKISYGNASGDLAIDVGDLELADVIAEEPQVPLDQKSINHERARHLVYGFHVIRCGRPEKYAVQVGGPSAYDRNAGLGGHGRRRCFPKHRTPGLRSGGRRDCSSGTRRRTSGRGGNAPALLRSLPPPASSAARLDCPGR